MTPRLSGTAGPAADTRPIESAAAPERLPGEAGWRWAFISPALVLMLALSVLPLANLFLESFVDVSWRQGRAVWTPVGFAHYAALPGDPLFRAGLFNTAVFALAAVVGQMVLGFVLALACSRIERARVVYRAVFILPILVPGIVIGAIWKLLLNYDFGLVNQAIALVGVEPRDWLGDPATALASIVAVDIWHWTPFCFLLFLAGLESLPQDVFEASRIDGAGFWQELTHITLPMMLPTIVVTVAFRLVLALKVFDEVYLLTGGGPGTSTEVVSFTIYQRFFTEDQTGYGAAMAVAVIFIVSLLLVAGAAARRRGEVGR